MRNQGLTGKIPYPQLKYRLGLPESLIAILLQSLPLISGRWDAGRREVLAGSGSDKEVERVLWLRFISHQGRAEW
jgi:hypothetical protein